MISRLKHIIISFCILIVAPILFLVVVPRLQEATLHKANMEVHYPDPDISVSLKEQKESLKKEIKRLSIKFTSLTGNQPYLVINTSHNSFMLFVKKSMVNKGMCSTGSYILLRNGDKEQWLFETPKGMFRVQSKTTSPVWKKPDWAFVEEGLPVPHINDNSRFEYGVLGDYALGLGDGYLIHGTLFQRFLGLPVTHGCIRMNDADLKQVYNTLELGSRVYIY